MAKVAEFIKPFIEVRTKKQVSMKALEMALLRFKQQELSRKESRQPKFKVEKISVANALVIETFPKTNETHKILQKYYEFVVKQNGFCSITEGLEEITLVFEAKYKSELDKIRLVKPKVRLDNVGALYAQFSVEYLKFPGMLHHVLHIMLMQGINILEMASTSTSIVIYVAEMDLKLAFNTLHDRLFSA